MAALLQQHVKQAEKEQVEAEKRRYAQRQQLLAAQVRLARSACRMQTPPLVPQHTCVQAGVRMHLLPARQLPFPLSLPPSLLWCSARGSWRKRSSGWRQRR